MAEEIPVYVFTGFMDSGKTSLVEETLFENEFGEGAKGIIIMCEDGEKDQRHEHNRAGKRQLPAQREGGIVVG